MSMFSRKNKKIFALTMMMMPGFIWLLLIRYLPMFGIVMSFQDYTINYRNPSLLSNILNSPFNGLNNFRFVFQSDRALVMIRNTLGYNALWIVLTMVVAVAFAVMLSEITRPLLARIYQTLMFFPYFISWVVVAYFVYAFLAPTYGLLSDMSNWYFNPDGWPVILTLATLWKTVGYSCILYLAAITGIDRGLYEAASIDGATKWQQVWAITIPSIRPMIIILFIMAVGRIFNADFGLFYTVTRDSGPLYDVTTVIDTYVYHAMLGSATELGMSTAAGFLQNLVGFFCIMTANTIVSKIDNESSLF